MPDQPLLTVVIPSYQSEAYLADCLESISASADTRVEYILIDGGSTDRTMSIVEQYRTLFTHIISEPDSGQSNALNKGFSLADGRYLTWLNSDDVFLPGSVSKVLGYLEKGNSLWYACNQVYVNSEGRIIRVLESGGFEKWSWRFGALHVFGPSTIMAKSLFKDTGQLNEAFAYCMDYEYWYRLCRAGHQYTRMPVHLWGFRIHDTSKTSTTLRKISTTPGRMLEEQKQIRVRYLNEDRLGFKKIILLLVRIKRTITGPYLRSFLLTRKYRNTSFWKFSEN